jgi:methylated-DNA-[protein]-cysteine S-methyltransferase
MRKKRAVGTGVLGYQRNMENPRYIIFDTGFGPAGLAWTDRGVLAVAFPEPDAAAARVCLLRKTPAAERAAPPKAMKKIADDIVALFDGGKPDFQDVVLDDERVPDFDRSVLKLTRQISAGETKTYGDIAKALGDVSLSRRVGQALGRNPFPIIVPCHRVVGADGTMIGFSAAGGVEAKRGLLKIEGALAPELFD